ncbi:DUF4296 domain-containing protein [Flavobacteriaceae bacterium 3-367]|uniref:DUF4296 domain-containing protein n=1 Tax=Eudoraea algarum TaxID=3417568 RepID=UPI0032900EC0
MKPVIFLLLMFVLGSCAEKVIEKPDDLIGEDQMTSILYDLAIIGAAKKTNATLLQEHHIETMPYLYSKYDIDSVQFVESDRYYASLPEVYEKIYTSVEARLKKEEKEATEAKERRNDSISTAKQKAALKKRTKDSLP